MAKRCWETSPNDKTHVYCCPTAGQAPILSSKWQSKLLEGSPESGIAMPQPNIHCHYSLNFKTIYGM